MTAYRTSGLKSATNLLSGALFLALSAVAAAQAPPQASPTIPVLHLLPEQRLAIYQSVTEAQKSSIAPIGFHATVGAPVPDTVELLPLPDSVARLVPEAANFRVAMIDNQVVVVDPNTRQVVAVVTQEPSSTVR
jgi:hypothetical protein